MEIIARPGYFGKDRKQWEELFDARCGVGKWQECWQFHDDILHVLVALGHREQGNKL